MATVTVNDTPVRYEDSGGDGPAILFSHGFMMDHTMFDAQVAEFAGEYRCIRWDERGFGDTPSTSAFSYWDSAEAEWIPRWMANLEKHDLNVAGTALLSRDDVQPRASEITCPVLAIHGGDDQAITVDRARLFTDAVADSRGVVIVDGAAHAPNMTHPEIVNDALASLLQSL